MYLGPVGPIDVNGHSLTEVPEALHDDDLSWVNAHLALVDRRAVRRAPAADDALWIATERVRG